MIDTNKCLLRFILSTGELELNVNMIHFYIVNYAAATE